MKKTIAIQREDVFKILDGIFIELGNRPSSLRRIKAEKEILDIKNDAFKSQQYIKNIDGALSDIVYDRFHDRRGRWILRRGVDNLGKTIKEKLHIKGTDASILKKCCRAKILLQGIDALPDLISLYVNTKSSKLRKALRKVILKDPLNHYFRQTKEQMDKYTKTLEKFPPKEYLARKSNPNLPYHQDEILALEYPLSEVEMLALEVVFDNVDAGKYRDIMPFVGRMMVRKWPSNTSDSNRNSRAMREIDAYLRNKTPYTERDDIPLFPKLRDIMYKTLQVHRYDIIGKNDDNRRLFLQGICSYTTQDDTYNKFLDKILPNFLSQDIEDIVKTFKYQDRFDQSFTKVQDALKGKGGLILPDGTISQKSPQKSIMAFFENEEVIGSDINPEDAKRNLVAGIVDLIKQGEFDDCARLFSGNEIIDKALMEVCRVKLYRADSKNEPPEHISKFEVLVDVYHSYTPNTAELAQLSPEQQASFIKKKRLEAVQKKYEEIIDNKAFTAKLQEAIDLTKRGIEDPPTDTPWTITEWQRKCFAKEIVRRGKEEKKPDYLLMILSKTGLEPDVYTGALDALISFGPTSKKELYKVLSNDGLYGHLGDRRVKIAEAYISYADVKDAKNLIELLNKKCIARSQSESAQGRYLISDEKSKEAIELIKKTTDSEAVQQLATTNNTSLMGVEEQAKVIAARQKKLLLEQAGPNKDGTDAVGNYYNSYVSTFLILHDGNKREVPGKEYNHRDKLGAFLNQTDVLVELINKYPEILTGETQLGGKDKEDKRNVGLGSVLGALDLAQFYTSVMTLKLARNIVKDVFPKLNISDEKRTELINKLTAITKKDTTQEIKQKKENISAALAEIEEIYKNNATLHTAKNLGTDFFSYKADFDSLKKLNSRISETYISVFSNPAEKMTSPTNWYYLGQLLVDQGFDVPVKRKVAMFIIEKAKTPTEETIQALLNALITKGLSPDDVEAKVKGDYSKATEKLIEFNQKDKLEEIVRKKVNESKENQEKMDLQALYSIARIFIDQRAKLQAKDLIFIKSILEARDRVQYADDGLAFQATSSEKETHQLITDLENAIITLAQKDVTSLEAELKKTTTDENEGLKQSLATAYVNALTDIGKLMKVFTEISVNNSEVYKLATTRLLEKFGYQAVPVLTKIWEKLADPIKQRGIVEGIINNENKRLFIDNILWGALTKENLTPAVYQQVVDIFKADELIEYLRTLYLKGGAPKIASDACRSVADALISYERKMTTEPARCSYVIAHQWTQDPDKSPYSDETVAEAVDLALGRERIYRTPDGGKIYSELTKIANNPRIAPLMGYKYGGAGAMRTGMGMGAAGMMTGSPFGGGYQANPVGGLLGRSSNPQMDIVYNKWINPSKVSKLTEEEIDADWPHVVGNQRLISCILQHSAMYPLVQSRLAELTNGTGIGGGGIPPASPIEGA